jgi:3-oxoacyl-[acyl-carrier protein] reductase
MGERYNGPVRALVTGGNGALGSAICRQLARDGLQVIVHANRRPEAAQHLVEELVAAGHSAQAVSFDVADGAAAQAALEVLLADGPIQVVVNNAGIHDDAPLAGMSPAQWRRVLDVSLNGFYHVTQPLLLPMIRTRWGRIINMSSVAGVMGNRGQVNYSAAKAGLQGATKALALELASRGITVNAVAPGVIESPMTATVFSPDDIARIVPMQRAGMPEEVAAVVGFLASRAASYMTGQILSVNGGMA